MEDLNLRQILAEILLLAKSMKIILANLSNELIENLFKYMYASQCC